MRWGKMRPRWTRLQVLRWSASGSACTLQMAQAISLSSMRWGKWAAPWALVIYYVINVSLVVHVTNSFVSAGIDENRLPRLSVAMLVLFNSSATRGPEWVAERKNMWRRSRIHMRLGAPSRCIILILVVCNIYTYRKFRTYIYHLCFACFQRLEPPPKIRRVGQFSPKLLVRNTHFYLLIYLYLYLYLY